MELMDVKKYAEVGVDKLFPTYLYHQLNKEIKEEIGKTVKKYEKKRNKR